MYNFVSMVYQYRRDEIASRQVARLIISVRRAGAKPSKHPISYVLDLVCGQK